MQNTILLYARKKQKYVVNDLLLQYSYRDQLNSVSRGSRNRRCCHQYLRQQNSESFTRNWCCTYAEYGFVSKASLVMWLTFKVKVKYHQNPTISSSTNSKITTSSINFRSAVFHLLCRQTEDIPRDAGQWSSEVILTYLWEFTIFKHVGYTTEANSMYSPAVIMQSMQRGA